jgi:hypothetical protein
LKTSNNTIAMTLLNIQQQKCELEINMKYSTSKVCIGVVTMAIEYLWCQWFFMTFIPVQGFGEMEREKTNQA